MTNHAGYFILLNVAMGGGFPNGVAGVGTPTAATVSGPADAGRLRRRLDRAAAAPRRRPPRRPPPPPPPGGGATRTRTIQAESFNAPERRADRGAADASGGQNIGWIANGDWVRFDNVNFGSGAGPRLRRPGSRPAPAAASAAWSRCASTASATRRSAASRSATPAAGRPGARCPATSRAVTGTHTVFLTFTSGQPADFVNVNWFHFRN